MLRSLIPLLTLLWRFYGEVVFAVTDPGSINTLSSTPKSTTAPFETRLKQKWSEYWQRTAFERNTLGLLGTGIGQIYFQLRRVDRNWSGLRWPKTYPPPPTFWFVCWNIFDKLFRDWWRYQIRWILGKIPSGLRPPPSFSDIYVAIFIMDMVEYMQGGTRAR